MSIVHCEAYNSIELHPLWFWVISVLSHFYPEMTVNTTEVVKTGYRRSAPGRSAPRPPQTRSIRPNFSDDPPQVLSRSAPIKLHQI